jgi:hypothetical protein
MRKTTIFMMIQGTRWGKKPRFTAPSLVRGPTTLSIRKPCPTIPKYSQGLSKKLLIVEETAGSLTVAVVSLGDCLDMSLLPIT